ncbi:MAG: phosphatase PAP2 family protein [Prevotella sp.]|nr:phosphatase PAP2 family protein [Prevotella sp.]
MKKIVSLFVFGMMLNTVCAQDDTTVDAYFTTGEMPDMLLFMPGPPDSCSAAFANDVTRYFWGKEMRKDPERAAQAARDAVYGLATILTEFEEAFGMKITKEDTPEIYKVLLEGTATCDSICTLPKTRYSRTRPFVRFNEHTLVPELEEELNPHKSFPSGHTLLGWSSALLMMEINPDRANEILARGYRYGENRVVLGAHWQSDTDAARLAASAAYARLHTSERFLEQMKKAREEFKLLTDASPVKPTRAPQQTESATIYDLQGRQVSTPPQGVFIQGGQKRIK